MSMKKIDTSKKDPFFFLTANIIDKT